MAAFEVEPYLPGQLINIFFTPKEKKKKKKKLLLKKNKEKKERFHLKGAKSKSVGNPKLLPQTKIN